MPTSPAAICGWPSRSPTASALSWRSWTWPSTASSPPSSPVRWTPERAEEIDFSDLYETSAQLLIVKAGNADTYSTKESLAGLKVGAQKGTIQSQLIQSALPESELFELEKYPALALEVQNGNIAGLVVDQAVGEALVASSNGALEVSNFTFTAEEASFGKSVVIAKGNEDLVAVVNEVINKVTADGSYQKAYDEAVELAASLGL